MRSAALSRRILQTDPALMDEADLQALVIDTARLFGWRHFHTFDSRRSPSGFPDLVLVRSIEGYPDRVNGVLYVELKTEKGKLTDKQIEWRDALEAAGEVFLVWRPSMWDEIVRVLR